LINTAVSISSFPFGATASSLHEVGGPGDAGRGRSNVFGLQEKPFGLMTHALDDLKPGEIYIATGGTMQSANWGEIMTATARTRGAVGAVVNGYHRDTPQVLSQNWPVFSRGTWAQDSAPRMKVVDFRCRIEIEGTTVENGDLILGDIDGVVVIPHALEEEVITKALVKARSEKVVRKEIENGNVLHRGFRKIWNFVTGQQ
jgi:regulator of RNase E activity RraA